MRQCRTRLSLICIIRYETDTEPDGWIVLAIGRGVKTILCFSMGCEVNALQFYILRAGQTILSFTLTLPRVAWE